ncbi:MAG TPA: hypothetical protein VGU90_00575 [Terriglobales bacterium]|nr:hypothetical protein [Terriglobales bacterium]
MVSKCANPECAATFRYFHTGKLFRVESPAVALHDTHDDGSMKKPMRRLEFFWLCDNCADKMSLTFEKGAGVAVRPKFARAATAI